MPAPEDLLERLTPKHAHCLRYWDELDNAQQAKLARQIRSIAVTEMDEAFIDSADVYTPKTEDLSAIADDHIINIPNLQKQDAAKLKHIKDQGLAAIRRGEVAAFVLAGGQASRLGSDKPKGTIPLGLGLTRHDSLLDLQAAKILSLEKLAAGENSNVVGIPWIVMTSESTYQDTCDHIDTIADGQFNRDEKVVMVTQDNIPAFDEEGRFMLADKDRIFTAPNGNGGVWSVISSQIDFLKKKGVKYVHMYCVDNILTKAVVREDPAEKVGVICMDGSQPSVVEYSELGQLASRTTSSGALEFREGNIANHLFSLDFIIRTKEARLRYHRAEKKIRCIDPTSGEIISPSKNNGIKLEKFVFDVFFLAKSFYVMEVAREEEFSPLKNAESTGKECISTCIRDLVSLHTSWVRNCKPPLPEGYKVVINPHRSYDGENLEEIPIDFPLSENGKFDMMIN